MFEQEDRIETLLTERGINGVSTLLGDLENRGISEEVILTTIKWWDDLPAEHKGTGLLVSRLRDGGAAKYRRTHERTGVDGEIVVGPQQLSWLRGIGLTPDGVDRETLAEMCEKLAKKAQTTPDELIDSALDPAWQETPPHPANVFVLGESPEMRTVRYQTWLHQTRNEGHPDRPDSSLTRREDEDDFDFACRFWDWKEPPELAERARKLEASRVARAAAAKAMPGKELAIASEEARRAIAPAPAPGSADVAHPEPQSDVVEAPVRPDLDEKFGADDDVPWDDEDEDPW